ncbi:hypothetical protein TWF694_000269 [Orbilia ellipsospora]|uniref:Uncharacterized protein n=1 Tax=Orbilia ellipsospora TaxID=2528407 RepID=A0AAV9XNG3_9PEZI
MRWFRSFPVFAAAAASLAQALVPEALSEAFVSGMTLSVKFGDTTVQDDSTVSAGSIPTSPVFTINSPKVPIPNNTLYTIVLLDITNSRNPTTEAVLHYAASNLQAPSGSGGDLKFGAMNFQYVAPDANSGTANYIFLAYSQTGDIELNLQSVPQAGDDKKFSINIFRQDNGFQLADTGLGFTVQNAAASSSSSSSSSPPSSSQTSFTFPNSTTTTSPPSSTTEQSTTSIPSNFTTSTTTPPPPPQQSTSYLTLSVSGSTRTVVYTAPNDPGSTIGTSPTTSANPSVITNEPNSASHNAISRSAIALLALFAAFAAF